VRERERLIARIRQIRRSVPSAAEAPPGAPDRAEPDQLRTLTNRIEHLEQLVQGLQDSVHRESARHTKRITDLEAQIQPAALGRALSEDARARGL
jgi:hypothetical protein